MAQGKRPSQAKVIDFTKINKNPIVRLTQFQGYFAQEGYLLQKNIMTGHIELNGKPLTDHAIADIRMRLRELDDGGGKASDLSKKDRVQDAIICTAEQNPYHPIIRYLRGCEEVYVAHTEIDWIGRFCACFKTPYPEIFRRFMTKWLIGCIARVEDGYQNFVLVLKGPQNIGKSFLAAWLASGPAQAFDLGTNPYFHEGAIDPTNKDHIALLATKWIWSSDEIGGTLRRRDRNELKEFLTKQECSLRLPYDKYPVTLKRNCSIIANTNEDTFLDDPTGNRRYLVLEVEAIDHVYSSESVADTPRSVSVHDLWGQVSNLYHSGERPHLEKLDLEWQSAQNQAYETTDPIETWLDENYTPDSTSFVSTQAILEKLVNDKMLGVINKAGMMRLSETMKKLKIPHVKLQQDGRRFHGYRLKKI